MRATAQWRKPTVIRPTSRLELRRTAPDEVPDLAPVEEVAQTGRTQSDRIRAMWRGDRNELIAALAIS